MTVQRGQQIKLWNIELNRLEVSINISYSEIKSAKFSDPYPLFLVADNEGLISFET